MTTTVAAPVPRSAAAATERRPRGPRRRSGRTVILAVSGYLIAIVFLRPYAEMVITALRPAFLVAALINVINVFNSFPIIWEMTGGGPGHETSTTTVFMYQLKQAYIGESAAMSVINFLLVIIVVLVFLKATRWKDQVN